MEKPVREARDQRVRTRETSKIAITMKPQIPLVLCDIKVKVNKKRFFNNKIEIYLKHEHVINLEINTEAMLSNNLLDNHEFSINASLCTFLKCFRVS